MRFLHQSALLPSSSLAPGPSLEVLLQLLQISNGWFSSSETSRACGCRSQVGHADHIDRGAFSERTQ